MKITTISDVHGKQGKISRPVGGDLIICSGDISPRGTANDIEEFLRWYSDLDYEHKILIAGNHDWDFERMDNGYYVERCEDYGITYLNDSGTKVQGLKIWGSSITLEFNDWAFNRSQSKIGEHWAKIPDNTDILVTHGPPYGILDLVQHPCSPNLNQGAGCNELMWTIEQIKPKMHVFGHIHENRGIKVKKLDKVPVTFVNASCLDLWYKPYEGKQFNFDWNKVILGKSCGEDF